MAEITVDEIREKFQTLQRVTQTLKEEKIGYESKLNTLQSQYDEKVQKLLKDTGTETLEDAVKFCKEKKSELETLKSELDSEISKYLDTVEESGEANSEGTEVDDFFA